MNNHIPILNGGTSLNVKLKNVTQDNELKAEKARIFSFIKRKLKNAHLTLHTEVVVDGQQGNRAFTAAERAKLMAEKNPSLLLLTKKFDLDVEI
jgi:DNA polymerase-3 subunit gamma/tau